MLVLGFDSPLFEEGPLAVLSFVGFTSNLNS
jgi:hypothetical protein